jgi:hypothetical protein
MARPQCDTPLLMLASHVKMKVIIKTVTELFNRSVLNFQFFFTCPFENYLILNTSDRYYTCMGGYRPVLGVLKQEMVLLTQKKSFTPQHIPSRINMSHMSEKLKTLQNFQSSY